MSEVLRTVAKADHGGAHELDGRRVFEVEEGHRQTCPRIKMLFALLTQEITHGNRYITEINIHRAWVQALMANRAVVGHIIEFIKVLERDAATRLLFIQK